MPFSFSFGQICRNIWKQFKALGFWKDLPNLKHTNGMLQIKTIKFLKHWTSSLVLAFNYNSLLIPHFFKKQVSLKGNCLAILEPHSTIFLLLYSTLSLASHPGCYAVLRHTLSGTGIRLCSYPDHDQWLEDRQTDFSLLIFLIQICRFEHYSGSCLPFFCPKLHPFFIFLQVLTDIFTSSTYF